MSSITASPPATWLRFLPALACMVAIYLLSDQPKLPEIRNLSAQLTSVLGHFTVYFALAVLLWWALRAFDLSTRQRVTIALTVAVLYGLSDEWHQRFVPGRTPDVMDVITDAIGATAGILVIERLARSRRFRRLIPR